MYVCMYVCMYVKPVPEKFGTKVHVRRAGNRYRFSGTGLRRRFLVCVSLALNAYGGRSYYFRLEMRDFRRKMQKNYTILINVLTINCQFELARTECWQGSVLET